MTHKEMEEIADLYESPADYLYYEVMRGCRCGHGQDIAEKAWEIFDAIGKREPGDDVYKLIYADMYNETITQWFDSLDLIDHGSSVGGSWLSGKGKELHRFLSTYYQKNEWFGYDKIKSIPTKTEVQIADGYVKINDVIYKESDGDWEPFTKTDKQIEEYIRLKNNPLADMQTVKEKREQLLWLNTSTMSTEEKRRLSEALDR